MAGKNSRFTVGVHILSLLAHEQGRTLTSEYIAVSVNTNPVVIRRLLGLLGQAGLVSTSEGAGGGTMLARPAERITLRDVYRAVEPGPLFGGTRNDPNPLCPVGRNIQGVLVGVNKEVERRMDEQLAQTTIAGVLASVRKEERE
jgi:DNA-binding IscR family transcriptional regulator